MTPMTAFFIYLLIWWLTLFTVLPLGVKPHGETGKGFDAGAPEKPDLARKLILNTAIAAVILGIIQVLVVTGVIDWTHYFESAMQ